MIKIFTFLLVVAFGVVAHADTSVTIAFYGDSTTYGAQTNNGQPAQTPLNEPAVVQSMLQMYFGPGRVVALNHGVGGTQASQLLYGTDGRHKAFDAEMAASPADIVVFNFALNDFYYNAAPQPGYIREGVDDYWFYMAELCQIARDHGKICVFQEPNPVLGVGQTWKPQYNPSIYSYVYVLRQVAQQMNAPIVHQFDTYQRLPQWDTAWLSDDHTHPTDAGYAFKAANTAAVLRPLVAKILGVTP